MDFWWSAKAPPPEPKKVDSEKKKATGVASTSGTKIATSNPFAALNTIDSDDCGNPTDVEVSGNTMDAKEVGSLETGNVSQDPLVSDSMEANAVGPTPIVEKIGEFERLLIDGKATLVDDNGNPIKKVDYQGYNLDLPATSFTKRVNPFTKVGEIVDSDSDDEEVVNTFDESSNLFGGGHDRENDYDDYDYDNYADQVYDLPGNLDAYYDTYGIKLQGLGRK